MSKNIEGGSKNSKDEVPDKDALLKEYENLTDEQIEQRMLDATKQVAALDEKIKEGNAAIAKTKSDNANAEKSKTTENKKTEEVTTEQKKDTKEIQKNITAAEKKKNGFISNILAAAAARKEKKSKAPVVEKSKQEAGKDKPEAKKDKKEKKEDGNINEKIAVVMRDIKSVEQKKLSHIEHSKGNPLAEEIKKFDEEIKELKEKAIAMAEKAGISHYPEIKAIKENENKTENKVENKSEKFATDPLVISIKAGNIKKYTEDQLNKTISGYKDFLEDKNIPQIEKEYSETILAEFQKELDSRKNDTQGVAEKNTEAGVANPDVQPNKDAENENANKKVEKFADHEIIKSINAGALKQYSNEKLQKAIDKYKDTLEDGFVMSPDDKEYTETILVKFQEELGSRKNDTQGAEEKNTEAGVENKDAVVVNTESKEDADGKLDVKSEIVEVADNELAKQTQSAQEKFNAIKVAEDAKIEAARENTKELRKKMDGVDAKDLVAVKAAQDAVDSAAENLAKVKEEAKKNIASAQTALEEEKKKANEDHEKAVKVAESVDFQIKEEEPRELGIKKEALQGRLVLLENSLKTAVGEGYKAKLEKMIAETKENIKKIEESDAEKIKKAEEKKQQEAQKIQDLKDKILSPVETDANKTKQEGGVAATENKDQKPKTKEEELEDQKNKELADHKQFVKENPVVEVPSTEKSKEDLKEFINLRDKDGMGKIAKDVNNGIPGFDKLPEGQQMLILKGLDDALLKHVDEYAVNKFNKKMASFDKKGFFGKVSNFFGRALTGMRKNYLQGKYKKEELSLVKGEKVKGFWFTGRSKKEINSDESKIHRMNFINKNAPGLMQVYGNSGINATLENGKVVADFSNIARLEGASSKLTEVATKYNKIANEFAHTPKDNKKLYEKARADYEQINGEYVDALREHAIEKNIENPKSFAAKHMLDSNALVGTMSYLAADQDATKKLTNIAKTPAYRKAIQDTVTERGLMFAGGYLARNTIKGAAYSVLGVSAAAIAAGTAPVSIPVIAAVVGASGLASGVVGYFTGRKRAGTTLEEKEKMARAGNNFYKTNDGKIVARPGGNFFKTKDGEKWLEKSREIDGRMEQFRKNNQFAWSEGEKKNLPPPGKIAEWNSLKEERKSFDKIRPNERVTNVGVNNTEKYLKRFSDAKMAFENATTEPEKQKALSHLKTITDACVTKIEKNEFDYGRNESESYISQNKLMKEVQEAAIIIEQDSQEKNKDINIFSDKESAAAGLNYDSRFRKMVMRQGELNAESTKEAQEFFKSKQGKKSMRIAGLFGSAGSVVGWGAEHFNWGENIDEFANSKFGFTPIEATEHAIGSVVKPVADTVGYVARPVIDTIGNAARFVADKTGLAHSAVESGNVGNVVVNNGAGNITFPKTFDPLDPTTYAQNSAPAVGSGIANDPLINQALYNKYINPVMDNNNIITKPFNWHPAEALNDPTLEKVALEYGGYADYSNVKGWHTPMALNNNPLTGAHDGAAITHPVHHGGGVNHHVPKIEKVEVAPITPFVPGVVVPKEMPHLDTIPTDNLPKFDPSNNVEPTHEYTPQEILDHNFKPDEESVVQKLYENRSNATNRFFEDHPRWFDKDANHLVNRNEGGIWNPEKRELVTIMDKFTEDTGIEVPTNPDGSDMTAGEFIDFINKFDAKKDFLSGNYDTKGILDPDTKFNTPANYDGNIDNFDGTSELGTKANYTYNNGDVVNNVKSPVAQAAPATVVNNTPNIKNTSVSDTDTSKYVQQNVTPIKPSELKINQNLDNVEMPEMPRIKTTYEEWVDKSVSEYFPGESIKQADKILDLQSNYLISNNTDYLSRNGVIGSNQALALREDIGGYFRRHPELDPNDFTAREILNKVSGEQGIGAVPFREMMKADHDAFNVRTDEFVKSYETSSKGILNEIGDYPAKNFLAKRTFLLQRGGGEIRQILNSDKSTAELQDVLNRWVSENHIKLDRHTTINNVLERVRRVESIPSDDQVGKIIATPDAVPTAGQDIVDPKKLTSPVFNIKDPVNNFGNSAGAQNVIDYANANPTLSFEQKYNLDYLDHKMTPEESNWMIKNQAFLISDTDNINKLAETHLNSLMSKDGFGQNTLNKIGNEDVEKYISGVRPAGNEGNLYDFVKAIKQKDALGYYRALNVSYGLNSQQRFTDFLKEYYKHDEFVKAVREGAANDLGTSINAAPAVTQPIVQDKNFGGVDNEINSASDLPENFGKNQSNQIIEDLNSKLSQALKNKTLNGANTQRVVDPDDE